MVKNFLQEMGNNFIQTLKKDGKGEIQIPMFGLTIWIQYNDGEFTLAIIDAANMVHQINL